MSTTPSRKDTMARVTSFAKEHRNMSWANIRAAIGGFSEDELQVLVHLTPRFLECVLDVSSQIALHVYLRAEVWGDPFRTRFWLLNALEHFAHFLLTNRIDTYGIRILYRSVVEGAGMDVMACHVHACLARHVTSFTQEEALWSCRLLKPIVSDKSARPNVSDPKIFRGLASLAAGSDRVATAVLGVFLEGEIFSFADAFVMAEQSAHRLIGDFVGVSHLALHVPPGSPTHLVLSLRFLECLAGSVEWHPYLSEWVVALSRYNWPVIFGPLVANMLGTTSVHFVVALARAGGLERLVSAAYAHSTTTDPRGAPSEMVEYGREMWTLAMARLCSVWPSRVAATLHPSDDDAPPPSTTYECPITLQPCVRPAVASDGHTYERDALMRLLVESDVPVSPLTKAPLSLVAFDNFSIRSA